MLNSKGGIESDLTVTCIEENKFRVVTGSGVRTHDKKHILKHLNSSVNLKDITDDFACFGIFGPKSRELLTEIFGDYFSNDGFPIYKGGWFDYNYLGIGLCYFSSGQPKYQVNLIFIKTACYCC